LESSLAKMAHLKECHQNVLMLKIAFRLDLWKTSWTELQIAIFLTALVPSRPTASSTRVILRGGEKYVELTNFRILPVRAGSFSIMADISLRLPLSVLQTLINCRSIWGNVGSCFSVDNWFDMVLLSCISPKYPFFTHEVLNSNDRPTRHRW